MRTTILLLSFVTTLALGTAFLPAQTKPSAKPSAKPLVERNSPLQVVEPDAEDRALRMTPVVRAVQRAADSVVSVYLQNQNQLARRQPITQGQGSGVILDASGLIITNWHVVAPVLLGARQGIKYGVVIKLRDGRERRANILSSSPTRDLALLQLELKGNERVKPIEIGRSSDLMIGETVIAIGNPQGHANTVTSGVLSAKGRSIKVRAPDNVVRKYADLLQTDAAINQGNSGGALLDITGRLIGINNAMSANAENIGFAIPMDIVREQFQKELLRSTSFVASATAPWFGFEVADRDGKVIINEIVAGGPAAAAGIRAGDHLVKIGEQEVHSSIDYLRFVYALASTRTLPLTVQRDGRAVRINTRPIPRYEGAVLAGMGTRVTQLDVDSHERIVRAATEAFYRGSNYRRVTLFRSVLRLDEVLPGSASHVTGLEKGDLILGIIVAGRFGDREFPMQTSVDLARLVEEQRGKKIRFIILRGDRDLVGTLTVRGATGKRY
jgi:serine protease Do